MSERFAGTVRYFMGGRRYGFILGDDGREYFFHEQNLPRNRRWDPQAMDRVEFEPRVYADGPHAGKSFAANIGPERVEKAPSTEVPKQLNEATKETT